MGTASQGSQTRMAFDVDASDVSGFDANSFQMLAVSDTMGATETHAQADGMRGTRERVAGRQRKARRRVGGQIVLQPTPAELDFLLPWILGTAESSDVFAIAETLLTRSLLIDKLVERCVYTGCVVSRAVFQGQQGTDPISLTLDIEATDEVQSATSFPGTVPAIDDSGVYVFPDTTFALSADASASEVQAFTLTIDNMVDAERYMNSLTRSQIPTRDMLITLAMTLPYTADEKDLYRQAIAGAAGTLTLTNGGVSTLFSFANLKAEATPPVRNGKNELVLPLNMQAYRVIGGARALVVTNDSAA